MKFSKNQKVKVIDAYQESFYLNAQGVICESVSELNPSSDYVWVDFPDYPKLSEWSIPFKPEQLEALD